jgi:hypothetical protein
MKKRSISDLKGDFLHVHKCGGNKQNGIISTLMGGGDEQNVGSGKIKDVYESLTQSYGNCEQCKFKMKLEGGDKSKKKVYIENQDLCYVGTRVKLVNPSIVRIGGKTVKFNYKTIVRRCNKHELELKHKK